MSVAMKGEFVAQAPPTDVATGVLPATAEMVPGNSTGVCVQEGIDTATQASRTTAFAPATSRWLAELRGAVSGCDPGWRAELDSSVDVVCKTR
jgi:hypothetical protein